MCRLLQLLTCSFIFSLLAVHLMPLLELPSLATRTLSTTEKATSWHYHLSNLGTVRRCTNETTFNYCTVLLCLQFPFQVIYFTHRI